MRNTTVAQPKPLPHPCVAAQATPLLFKACASGTHFPQAVLTMRRAGFDYMKITLTDVLISSVTQAPGSTVAGIAVDPDEEVTLRFATFQASYTAQKPDGSLDTPVCSCWNTLLNTACSCASAG